MPLLSAQDERMLKEQLASLERPVTLLLFTQTFGGSDTGPVAKQILDELARLSDRIAVVEKSFVLDTADRELYGVDKSPAIVVLSEGKDTRMRFYGAPTGYEFVPLVEAIIIAGTGDTELEPATLELLAAVDKPLHLQVFSTPT